MGRFCGARNTDISGPIWARLDFLQHRREGLWPHLHRSCVGMVHANQNEQLREDQEPRTFSMQSGIEAEAGHIEEAGDIEEDIGDEADGATDGGTGVAGATCSDGPIDLIGGSIASMDVLTGRRVARPGPAGGGRAAPIGGGDLGDLARDGNSLEVECSVCKPSRLVYIEPLSLGLPKRMPVPEVANHLVCSVCAPRTRTPITDLGQAGCTCARG